MLGGCEGVLVRGSPLFASCGGGGVRGVRCGARRARDGGGARSDRAVAGPWGRRRAVEQIKQAWMTSMKTFVLPKTMVLALV